MEGKKIYIYILLLYGISQIFQLFVCANHFCFLTHIEKKIVCFILLWGEDIWFVEDN